MNRGIIVTNRVEASYVQSSTGNGLVPGSKAIPSGQRLSFTMSVTGSEGGADYYFHKFEGSIKNVAGVTSLDGSLVEISIEETGAAVATWVAAVTANDTSDALDVTISAGTASTNWRIETAFNEVAL